MPRPSIVRPRKGKDVRSSRPSKIYLPVAPPGITKEYKIFIAGKLQTYVPCNNDDVIQDGIHTIYRAFVGKTLQDFVDFMYISFMDEEFNELEVQVVQITR
jgi:hypothetical protein